MLPFDGFRDPDTCHALLTELHQLADGMKVCNAGLPPSPVTFMEVCGTHTMSIMRYGLRACLPSSVRLVSGPGCPVCVTPGDFIDRAAAVAQVPDVAVATFGDLVRVPGSRTSLERTRAQGGDVRIVYSPLQVLDMASHEPKRAFVFLGVGFETTAPGVAALLLEAERREMRNVFVLNGHKTMPAALLALANPEQAATGSEPDAGSPANPVVRGFLCPGHVSTIIGSRAYERIARERSMSCVIAGFEPVDILQGLVMLLRQFLEDRAEVENAYGRAVKEEGNLAAQQIMERVFQPCDATWRGLGRIPESGLELRPEWRHRDAALRFQTDLPPSEDDPACRCGDVLRGVIEPPQCPLFSRHCTPLAPRGACMVSSEGTCAAYYRYGEGRQGEAR